jgi:hypothetical protein
MVFEQCATEGPELDPEVVIAAQRLETLRRAWELFPEMRPLLCEAGKAYADGGHPAAMEESGEIAPAPPPGWKTRKGWKKGLPCFGPVGLALQSARAYALTLLFSDEEGVTVRQEGEVELRCCIEPPQTVRPRLLRMMGRARMRAAQDARDSLGGAAKGDIFLAVEILQRLPEGDRGIWRTITSGQFMTAHHAKKCGLVESDTC